MPLILFLSFQSSIGLLLGIILHSQRVYKCYSWLYNRPTSVSFDCKMAMAPLMAPHLRHYGGAFIENPLLHHNPLILDLQAQFNTWFDYLRLYNPIFLLAMIHGVLHSPSVVKLSAAHSNLSLDRWNWVHKVLQSKKFYNYVPWGDYMAWATNVVYVCQPNHEPP